MAMRQRARGGAGRPPARPQPKGGGGEPGGRIWLYGRHVALAAIANPRRRLIRAVCLAEERPLLIEACARASLALPIEPLDRAGLARLLPPDAVHQGLAVLAEPLPEVALQDALFAAGDGPVLFVALDQATDPRNVGAALRSAAAFGAAGVVLQDRHAPAATAALAKAASGGLEVVPLIRVVNLARALRTLQEAGVSCLGLAHDAERELRDALAALPEGGRLALVLGAEDSGLRRLVRESCDALARIAIAPAIESLNVSTAAAIALYEARRSLDARARR